ncbi:hypothetical protein EFY10_03785 [Micrococcus sp. RIT608]|nr:hypothetical protein B8X03_08870 [Micrococcus luteus]RNM14518.1 hypothetical protein EFY10_03785 [Micrococcus sp. RIT608]
MAGARETMSASRRASRGDLLSRRFAGADDAAGGVDVVGAEVVEGLVEDSPDLRDDSLRNLD